ncbi:uncharacterized protein LOC133892290 [Phragmites australis]|uniref:uncharacterized protein LOC133892290 n=1 Tax=Phragmites australis TaxID=29695 RepID=UPI002D77382A|nr:uncharacterized protein LOC133892290 [Phragmites australis]
MSSATSAATAPVAISGPVSGLPPDHAAPVAVNPFATTAIKSHVSMTLELKNPNYNKWVSFFHSMCGKFGLKSHIDSSVPARLTDPAWEQVDCCVHSWLFGSIADDILDLAMELDQTARDLCVAIENLFQANKMLRAIFVSHKFHSMTQGDRSASEYCQHMKIVANSLCDVGHTISESQLILNLLRSLNPHFPNTADDIANSPDLPSFVTARNMLVLKERRPAGSSTSSCSSGVCCSSTSFTAPSGGDDSSASTRGDNRHGKGRGRFGGNRDQQQ